jgi:hypothetical protein
MNIKKLFFTILLSGSLVGCSVNALAEDVKSSDEAKAILEKFKIGFEQKLNALKHAQSGEEDRSSIYKDSYIKFHSNIDFKEYFRQQAKSAHFFLGSYLEDHLGGCNPLKYKEFGILDEILDIVFNEKTGLTPNTLFSDERDKVFSLFFRAATDAVYSFGHEESAKILFKKLKKRGGNVEVLCDLKWGKAEKTSAREEVEHFCKVFCKKSSYEQENNLEHPICTRAKDIFVRMGYNYPRS